MRRFLLIVFVACAAVLLGPTLPGALAADNAAVAVNVHDGSSVFRLAFKISRVGSDVVEANNAAVAYASCANCETTAIAIQVVLLTGEANTLEATNLALAMNEQCTLCETFAAAYQFVFSTFGNVHFTAEGNRELAEIRRELHALRQEQDSLSPEELDARIDALVDRLEVVLRQELVAAGVKPSEPTTTDSEEPPTTSTATEPAETTTTTGAGTDTTETTTSPDEGSDTTTEPTSTTTESGP